MCGTCVRRVTRQKNVGKPAVSWVSVSLFSWPQAVSSFLLLGEYKSGQQLLGPSARRSWGSTVHMNILLSYSIILIRNLSPNFSSAWQTCPASMFQRLLRILFTLILYGSMGGVIPRYVGLRSGSGPLREVTNFTQFLTLQKRTSRTWSFCGICSGNRVASCGPLFPCEDLELSSQLSQLLLIHQLFLLHSLLILLTCCGLCFHFLSLCGLTSPFISSLLFKMELKRDWGIPRDFAQTHLNQSRLTIATERHVTMLILPHF